MIQITIRIQKFLNDFLSLHSQAILEVLGRGRGIHSQIALVLLVIV